SAAITLGSPDVIDALHVEVAVDRPAIDELGGLLGELDGLWQRVVLHCFRIGGELDDLQVGVRSVLVGHKGRAVRRPAPLALGKPVTHELLDLADAGGGELDGLNESHLLSPQMSWPRSSPAAAGAGDCGG